MEEEKKHIPVLVKEVIELLDPKPNENFIDGTAGFGGHSREILERIKPDGKLLMIEWDPEVYQELKKEFIDEDRAVIVNDSYANLEKIAESNSFKNINGILLDIGLSSFDIDNSNRGFSYKKDEPLDMRFSPQSPKSAYEIINGYSEDDLEAVLREFGEERFSRRIARTIVEQRKKKEISTTQELAKIVESCLPGWKKDLSRSFQAIRIEANQELENLKRFLPQAEKLLDVNGRLGIISFHSLEDRIVKNYFKEAQIRNTLKPITKKPVIASASEIAVNKRAKPSKLRVAIKN